MKKYGIQFFSFLLFLLLSQSAQAQFGISGGLAVNEAENWTLFEDNLETQLPGNGYSIGIDYWFRLKNLRIEFTPELNYTSASVSPLVYTTQINTNFLSFYFNANFYLLDLLNDCNCPTFSKQNDFFQKGFFVRLSPGVTMPLFDSNYANNGIETGSFAPNLGLGLGLDIGLTDLVTLTPLVMARYTPSIKWESTYPTAISEIDAFLEDTETSLIQFFAGLRLGFRFDDW